MEEAIVAIRLWLAKKLFRKIGDAIFPYIQWVDADWLTTCRAFVSIPIILMFLTAWHGPWLWRAELLFMLACFSDFIDGWLARKKGIAKRKKGKMLDGFADRILIRSVYLFSTLMSRNWVLVMLAIALIISDLPFWWLKNGKDMEHYFLGKAKMTGQCFTAGLLILLPVNQIIMDFCPILMLCTIALSIGNSIKHLRT